jgi:pSer/pThr/pTyr-binding forkhead associated (FHA) protein
MFPVAVDIGGKRCDILDVPTPNDGFLVIETVPKTFTDTRSFHAINMHHHEKFTIGRGNNCDIRISDISVSRVHATLKFKQGRLVIKDNCSKFGTLVHSPRPILVQPR